MKRPLSLALAVATLSLAACGIDPDDLPQATSLQLSPLASETAPAGSRIPVTITALDEDGDPVPGVAMMLTPDPGATVSPQGGATDAAGQLKATWTLGDAARTYGLIVSANGVKQRPGFHVKVQ